MVSYLTLTHLTDEGVETFLGVAVRPYKALFKSASHSSFALIIVLTLNLFEFVVGLKFYFEARVGCLNIPHMLLFIYDY